MKNGIQSLAVIALLAVNSASADPISVKPELVQVMPQSTFIPPGFDDNDPNVEIILSGDLANTCYRKGPTTAQVDLKEKKITIQNSAYVYSGCFCHETLVHYQDSVNLRMLPAGEYQVSMMDRANKPHASGVLKVAVATKATPDDYDYAPIEDVFMDNSDTSQNTVVLRGKYKSDCWHLQEVKVLYRATQIVEVLPISSVDTGTSCHDASVPFETKVKLQSNLKGSTLIYVRALNGQAVSKVVEF